MWAQAEHGGMVGRAASPHRLPVDAVLLLLGGAQLLLLGELGRQLLRREELPFELRADEAVGEDDLRCDGCG